jgi:hypothetical protein
MRPTLALTTAVLLSLQGASAARAQTTGPLRVHPENPRYFTDDSGKAILLAGSHTWPNLIDMGPSDPPPAFDFDAYLAWLRRYGHNFTRGWAWEPTRWDTTGMKNPAWRNGDHHVAPHPWQRTGPGLALDGKPRFDLEKPNPAYLERIKMRVAKAQAAGVFISIMLFEGYGVQFQSGAWPNHPFNAANNVNDVDGDKDGDGKGIEIHQLARRNVTRIQKAYVRWLVEALNDYDNVLYEISNETHPGSTEWQYEMIEFIRKCEKDLPNRHPVGMTYQNRRGRNETLFNGPADWVSPNSEGGFRDDPPDMKGSKVVIVDTDHLWGIGGDATWVWKSVTRGLNPIFMDTYDGKVLGKVRPEDEAPRQAMGQAIEYSRRMNLARTTPKRELASTGYCLAEPGVAYLVFAPQGGEIKVDLRAGGGAFAVEWRDVVSGQVANVPSASGGAMQTFRAPFAGAAVLFLKNESRSMTSRIEEEP